MTLRAGSYLRLLTEPDLDLMDIVDEQTPLVKRKTRESVRHIQCDLVKRDFQSEEDEYREYRYPHFIQRGKIDYECTHGERFANCSQCKELFTTEPVLVPHVPKTNVWAHNGSPNVEDWSLHSVAPISNRDFRDSRYGLLCWDLSVYNEIYPGYPGDPHHLLSDTAGGLDIDEELVRAYDTIRPAITSDMSLLVTLGELKDFVTLFTEPVAFANRLIRTIGRKTAKKWTFSEIFSDPEIVPFIAKSFASGHLFTEFGLKQTVRDLSSLYSTFLMLDNNVRKILDGLGENTRHYSLPLYEEREELSENFFQDYNWICQRVWETSLTRKFVCTMKYTSELVDAFGQPISPNDTDLVKIGASLDKLGVNMNPAILWDLVPFSFVVDYFVSIGDWLETLKRQNLNLTFNVKDSCYSVKREFVTSGVTRRWTSVWDGTERFPDHPLAACEEYIGGIKFKYSTTHYDRVRFVPSLRMLSGVRTPEWHLPGKGQLQILSSLLTANLPIGRGKVRSQSRTRRHDVHGTK